VSHISAVDTVSLGSHLSADRQ